MTLDANIPEPTRTDLPHEGRAAPRTQRFLKPLIILGGSAAGLVLSWASMAFAALMSVFGLAWVSVQAMALMVASLIGIACAIAMIIARLLKREGTRP